MADTNQPEPKHIGKSRTAWVNVAIALGQAVPGVGAWEQEHPQFVLAAIAGINIALRLISHGRVTLFPDSSSDA